MKVKTGSWSQQLLSGHVMSCQVFGWLTIYEMMSKPTALDIEQTATRK